MTEEKKQEIIKSFKNCVIDKNGDCTDCAYDNHRIYCGKKDLMRDVFDLIQYQQAEIERLTDKNNELLKAYGAVTGLNTHLNNKRAELQKQVDELKIAVNDKAKKLAQHLYDMKDLYWDENGVNPRIEIRLDPQKFKRICEYYFGVEVD